MRNPDMKQEPALLLAKIEFRYREWIENNAHVWLLSMYHEIWHMRKPFLKVHGRRE